MASVSEKPSLEAALVRRAQEGDEAGFAALVERYGPRLRRFLAVKIGDHAEAEDLAQETFLKAYRNLERYDARYAFSTWLYVIAVRIARSHQRRRRPVPAEWNDSRTAADRDPHDCVELAEQHERLWRAARALPERQFDALYLRYAEEMSVGEVARALGKTQVHVRVMLHRARRRLADLMAAPEAELENEPAAEAVETGEARVVGQSQT